MKRKCLAIGIILLFLSTSCLSILAKEFSYQSTINDEIVVCEESIGDSYREIITFVHGSCTEITIKGLGFIRRAEIWTGDIKTQITLEGYRFPIINNTRSHFIIDGATHIKIPHFIGFRWRASTVSYGIYGIALGNIEW